MSEDMAAVYDSEDTLRAQQLKSLLEREGITVRVINDAAQGDNDDAPHLSPGRTVLAVFEPDADQARLIASQFEESTEGFLTVESADDGRETLSERPVCPGCGKPRITACPACGTTGGENFYDAGLPLDAEADSESSATSLLVCQTCDEAFTPQYPRLCEWCNHDFGDGTQIDEPDDPLEIVSPRVIATIIALLAVCLGVAAYFALMF